MKRYLKWLLILLAVCMALSSFAACDALFEEEVEAPEDESDNEIKPDIEKKNYGEEFYLWIMDDTNRPEYHWVNKPEGDVLSEAIYARQAEVYKHIGVEIIGTPRTESYLTYIEPFKNAVKNKDGSVDMMLSHNFSGVSSLVSENFLADISCLPGVNLGADYWNQEFMDDLSIADRYYLGFSDFNILYTHVITFNKTMMSQYEDVLPKSVYEMVRSYEWTLDQMISLAQLVSVDRTSDGKTADDTFGITGRNSNEFPGFLLASNIKLIEEDESGKYTVSLLNDTYAEKTTALVNKLKSLATSQYSYFDFNTTTELTVPLMSGRTLLHITPTLSLAGFLQHDISFGVLPYPMWDTAQKNVGYRHLQWGGYITVPNYMRNDEMVGETLELLAYYSEDVKTAYYEKMLGKQVADAPDDRDMLAIVWDTVCTEFAQTYCDALGSNGDDLLYLISKITQPTSTDSLNSSVAGIQRSANRAIETFITKVKNIKN